MNSPPLQFDPEIQTIADYVLSDTSFQETAYSMAYYCFLDSLACALMALDHPACIKLLGPTVPNAYFKQGARIPGTTYCLEPVQATFNIGTMIRWLDFNNTWLAAEWGHPSDNLAGILAVTDYISRNQSPISLRQVLTALIKAQEIQGILALENSFNRVGLDHVLLVKVATAAVVTAILGGSRSQLLNAISQAWVDGQSLRTYRQSPNTGSRKSWAAADASSRAVRLALISMTGEMGYPTALTAKKWGFYDASFEGKSLQLKQPYGSYVTENILFKVAYPAEFHAQTAIECALQLYPSVKDRCWDAIDYIEVQTQEAGMRIIHKTGPLRNPADRDHCLQYVIAIVLLLGELKAEHYESEVAKDPRIDRLREKMKVTEHLPFTRDYLNPNKRSVANALQIFFKDGSKTERIVVEYPLGHSRRRAEGIPILLKKFHQAINVRFPPAQVDAIQAALLEGKQEQSDFSTPIDQLISLMVQVES